MTWEEHVLAGALCATIAVMGASMASLRRRTLIGQFLLTNGFALLIGAVMPSLITGLFPVIKVQVAAGISLLAGFSIYGILGWLDKKIEKMPDGNLSDLLGPLSDIWRKKNDDPK